MAIAAVPVGDDYDVASAQPIAACELAVGANYSKRVYY